MGLPPVASAFEAQVAQFLLADIDFVAPPVDLCAFEVTNMVYF